MSKAAKIQALNEVAITEAAMNNDMNDMNSMNDMNDMNEVLDVLSGASGYG